MPSPAASRPLAKATPAEPPSIEVGLEDPNDPSEEATTPLAPLFPLPVAPSTGRAAASEGASSPDLAALPSLPALRVVVAPGSRNKELRIVVLGADEKPEPGVAAALLVPISVADGELIARLAGYDI